MTKKAINGFFIRDKTDTFSLRIGGYTQARYNMNWRNDTNIGDEFTHGFSLNRTRIFFEGKITDPFGYHFRLNIDDQGNVDLIAAYLQYAFNSKWSIRVGEQFMALSREDWMYAQDVLGLEFSPNDYTFGYRLVAGYPAALPGRKLPLVVRRIQRGLWWQGNFSLSFI